jgi:hypothetical protein
VHLAVEWVVGEMVIQGMKETLMGEALGAVDVVQEVVVERAAWMEVNKVLGRMGRSNREGR